MGSDFVFFVPSLSSPVFQGRMPFSKLSSFTCVYFQLNEITAMSESAGVATKTFLSILVIANVVGNTLVCVIIMRNRDMRYCISSLNVKIWNSFPFRV